jgi:hypothetical protein
MGAVSVFLDILVKRERFTNYISLSIAFDYVRSGFSMFQFWFGLHVGRPIMMSGVFIGMEAH